MSTFQISIQFWKDSVVRVISISWWCCVISPAAFRPWAICFINPWRPMYLSVKTMFWSLSLYYESQQCPYHIQQSDVCKVFKGLLLEATRNCREYMYRGRHMGFVWSQKIEIPDRTIRISKLLVRFTTNLSFLKSYFAKCEV